jgi:hypothetical protein
MGYRRVIDDGNAADLLFLQHVQGIAGRDKKMAPA